MKRIELINRIVERTNYANPKLKRGGVTFLKDDDPGKRNSSAFSGHEIT